MDVNVELSLKNRDVCVNTVVHQEESGHNKEKKICGMLQPRGCVAN